MLILGQELLSSDTAYRLFRTIFSFDILLPRACLLLSSVFLKAPPVRLTAMSPHDKFSTNLELQKDSFLKLIQLYSQCGVGSVIMMTGFLTVVERAVVEEAAIDVVVLHTFGFETIIATSNEPEPYAPI